MGKDLIILVTLVLSFSLFAEEIKKTEITKNSKKINNGNFAWENGRLYFRSEKNFSLKFDGRIYLDFAHYSGSDYAFDGSDLRRGRIAFKVKLYKLWRAEFGIDVADNKVETKDMWMARLFGNNSMLKVGQFKVPFSMEELTSSLIITFMERSLANTFAPGRRMSIGYNYWGKYGQISTSVFGQEFGDSTEKKGDEEYGGALRGSLSYLTSNIVIHLGIGSFIETTEDNQGIIKKDSLPESKISKIKYLDTGEIKDVKYNHVSNIELALSYKFIRLQAEYMFNIVFRENNKRNLSFSGYYAHIGVFLTGEKKPYSIKAGKFLLVHPKRDWGAVELAFRFSSLNLNDIGINENTERYEGGTAKQYTLGLTWFFNRNFRLMFNYSYADHSKQADGNRNYKVPNNGIDMHILQSRFLANF